MKKNSNIKTRPPSNRLVQKFKSTKEVSSKKKIFEFPSNNPLRMPQGEAMKQEHNRSPQEKVKSKNFIECSNFGSSPKTQENDMISTGSPLASSPRIRAISSRHIPKVHLPDSTSQAKQSKIIGVINRMKDLLKYSKESVQLSQPGDIKLTLLDSEIEELQDEAQKNYKKAKAEVHDEVLQHKMLTNDTLNANLKEISDSSRNRLKYYTKYIDRCKEDFKLIFDNFAKDSKNTNSSDLNLQVNFNKFPNKKNRDASLETVKQFCSQSKVANDSRICDESATNELGSEVKLPSSHIRRVNKPTEIFTQLKLPHKKELHLVSSSDESDVSDEYMKDICKTDVMAGEKRCYSNTLEPLRKAGQKFPTTKQKNIFSQQGSDQEKQVGSNKNCIIN